MDKLLSVMIVVMVAASVFCFGGLGYSLYKQATAPDVNQVSHLVCFDMASNLRLNLLEHNIRFDHNIIRFTNGQGEYAVFPPEGWLCSIVEEGKK